MQQHEVKIHLLGGTVLAANMTVEEIKILLDRLITATAASFYMMHTPSNTFMVNLSQIVLLETNYVEELRGSI